MDVEGAIQLGLMACWQHATESGALKLPTIIITAYPAKRTRCTSYSSTHDYMPAGILSAP